jgi:ABC-type uncharacterized transport system substrate-binding protein
MICIVVLRRTLGSRYCCQIPIVFGNTIIQQISCSGPKPARPGGNATGVRSSSQMAVKQFGLLRELVTAAARIGLLINSNGPPP